MYEIPKSFLVHFLNVWFESSSLIFHVNQFPKLFVRSADVWYEWSKKNVNANGDSSTHNNCAEFVIIFIWKRLSWYSHFITCVSKIKMWSDFFSLHGSTSSGGGSLSCGNGYSIWEAETSHAKRESKKTKLIYLYTCSINNKSLIKVMLKVFDEKMQNFESCQNDIRYFSA